MQAQAGQKEFHTWADLIRVVATFLVVTFHVSGQPAGVWERSPKGTGSSRTTTGAVWKLSDSGPVIEFGDSLPSNAGFVPSQISYIFTHKPEESGKITLNKVFNRKV
jgi:hypothetical protein